MLISHGLRAASFKPSAGPPYVVSSASTYNTTSINVNVAMPSGVVAGDLLVVMYVVESNSGSPLSVPSGWTVFLTSATSPITAAIYKVSDGSEGATVTMNITSRNDCLFLAFNIRDYSSINTVGAWAATDTSSPLTNTGITPTASGLLIGYWGIRATSAISITSAPSGMTEIIKSGNPGVTGAAYYQDWGATVTGNREITTVGTINGSHSVLIQIV